MSASGKLRSMDTRHHLIRLLADGHFHSGEALAQRFGVSRAAVWKQVQGLSGLLDMEVHAVRGRGYRLARPLELLDPETIRSALPAATCARLSALEVHTSIDSTNSHLMRAAVEGAPSGQVCLAEQQTTGRGRRGRHWVSPFGSNIYLSILWRYPQAPMELSGLSLAAGLATVRALAAQGVQGVGLKWPNDVLWQGKKLAGLLLEVSGESGGPSQVVLGLGLNTRLSARQGEAIEQPWVDLASVPGGQGISRNALAAALLEQLLAALAGFHHQGLSPLLDEWNRNDLYRGKRVQLRMGERVVEGIHRGIDGSGALLLDSGDGVHAFHAGEVSLRANDAA